MIALFVMLASDPSAQATISIGVGSTGCQDVSRQILHDWFDVGDILSPDGKGGRPSADDLQCVSPASVRDAMPRRVAGSALKCFNLHGKGVCCDAQMRECAMR